MEPVRLGRSGLYVSPLCLGTMMFGGPTPLDEARRIADLALDRGVFFWDTADMYGTGASEEVLGELMAGRRQQIVLATKVFAPMGPGPNDRGLSARHIIEACEASLRRLRTDWIDLYYLHWPSRDTPLFGCSSFHPDGAHRATPFADRGEASAFEAQVLAVKALLDAGLSLGVQLAL